MVACSCMGPLSLSFRGSTQHLSLSRDSWLILLPLYSEFSVVYQSSDLFPLECPIKGQVFKECASACPATCTNPNPICTKQCVRSCECPSGQVIDEASKTCVPKDKCPSTCPPDKPKVSCLVDPCRFAQCPNHPDAVCVADFCGGCNARFFVGKKEVTDTCSELQSIS